MTLEADLYRLRLEFEKLFADPRIFDEPRTFVREFLQFRGLTRDRAEEIYETTGDVAPVDDAGRPSVTAGIGKFRLRGRTLRSEYMQRATLGLVYVDFGSGLLPEEHRRLWETGRWDGLAFQVKDFQHQHVRTEVADISELYSMLKARATPTTMATIELTGSTPTLFTATVRYLESRLKKLAESDRGTVEVYAARELDAEENKALERRLARESTGSTVYVILSAGPLALEQSR